MTRAHSRIRPEMEMYNKFSMQVLLLHQTEIIISYKFKYPTWNMLNCLVRMRNFSYFLNFTYLFFSVCSSKFWGKRKKDILARGMQKLSVLMQLEGGGCHRLPLPSANGITWSKNLVMLDWCPFAGFNK